MKVGFIGAGKVGCSLGKYLVTHGVDVVGYLSKHHSSAEQAAHFTGTRAFDSLEQVVQASDILFITTPDHAIPLVWEELRKLPLAKKCICHCSGSLSSAVFHSRRQCGAYGYSVHPLFAIWDKEHSYEALAHAVFTVEGDPEHLTDLQAWLERLGNSVPVISASKKSLYHCAAVTVSNHVLALVQTAMEMLQECGFDAQDAQQALFPLLENNVKTILEHGVEKALTGPVERGDADTVRSHLESLSGKDAALYQNLCARLLPIAQKKHPQRNYTKLQTMMEEWK